jgi:hypothetical protein
VKSKKAVSAPYSRVASGPRQRGPTLSNAISRHRPEAAALIERRQIESKDGLKPEAGHGELAQKIRTVME